MKLEFSVYRYNPDVDDAPRMQDYTLEAEEGRDMMLLDALIQLKEKDPTCRSVAPAVKGCVALTV
jgi:succinate dehydrogenase / fumarate reductase iron-sulfur subunit